MADWPAVLLSFPIALGRSVGLESVSVPAFNPPQFAFFRKTVDRSLTFVSMVITGTGFQIRDLQLTQRR